MPSRRTGCSRWRCRAAARRARSPRCSAPTTSSTTGPRGCCSARRRSGASSIRWRLLIVQCSTAMPPASTCISRRLRAAAADKTPKQFIDLEFEPTDWTAYDVAMIFIGTMNNRYGDYNTELENAAILASLVEQHGEAEGRALFDLLNPRFTDIAPTSIPRRGLVDTGLRFACGLSGGKPAGQPSRHVESSRRRRPDSATSSCWVATRLRARTRSSSTDRSSAGSTRLTSTRSACTAPASTLSATPPSGTRWSCSDTTGRSRGAAPGVQATSWMSSRNSSIRTIPDQYRYDGEYVDFDVRTESIAVRGSDPVEVESSGRCTDRSCSGMKKRGSPTRSIGPGTAASWRRCSPGCTRRGHPDWDEWRAEAEKSAINVNMYFRGRRRQHRLLSRRPVPAPGGRPRQPFSRSRATAAWTGRDRQSIDSANPHVLNPTGGFLANWNNKPGHGVMNPDFFFYSWSEADRVDYLNGHSRRPGQVHARSGVGGARQQLVCRPLRPVSPARNRHGTRRER